MTENREETSGYLALKDIRHVPVDGLPPVVRTAAGSLLYLVRRNVELRDGRKLPITFYGNQRPEGETAQPEQDPSWSEFFQQVLAAQNPDAESVAVEEAAAVAAKLFTPAMESGDVGELIIDASVQGLDFVITRPN